MVGEGDDQNDEVLMLISLCGSVVGQNQLRSGAISFRGSRSPPSRAAICCSVVPCSLQRQRCGNSISFSMRGFHTGGGGADQSFELKFSWWEQGSCPNLFGSTCLCCRSTSTKVRTIVYVCIHCYQTCFTEPIMQYIKDVSRGVSRGSGIDYIPPSG